MLSNRLRGLAQHIRLQTQQHPTAQSVLADRLRTYAEMARASDAASLADRLTETATGIDALAQAKPWQPMTTVDRDELAVFLERAADGAEKAEESASSNSQQEVR